MRPGFQGGATSAAIRRLIPGLVLIFALGAAGQERSIVFRGARLIPIDGPEIENGVLIVRGGKILYAGPATRSKTDRGAIIRDVTGMVIMPGLVDTHSHIGGPSGGDRSAPIQPEARAMDAINVRAATLQKAQAGGITTANIMPGSGHLVSGQTIYVKLRDGQSIEALAIRDQADTIMGGLKMANGTNSRKDPPFPGTRAKSAALVREAYLKALDYRARLARAEPGSEPAVDLGAQALLQAMDGKRIVHFHTHRHDDILTALRIAAEFQLTLVLHHLSEGWKVADQLAAAGVGCSLTLVDSPGGKLEARDMAFETAGLLEKAGALVAFNTDDPITDSRLFLRSAGLGVRAGMSRPGALAAITLAGAKMLHLNDRIGSLTNGKDADFIILSGDPLSVYTKVLETWVEGRRVFDRSDPADLLYAVGGYGASHDEDNALTHEVASEEGW